MPYFYVYPFAQNGQKSTVDTNPPGGGEMSYNQGFTINYEYELGVDTGALPIPRDQFNQLIFDITDNLRQYQLCGLYNWTAAADNNPGGTPTDVVYPLYARVRHDDGVNGVRIFENQVDNNTVEPGQDNSWSVISGNAQGNPVGTIITYAGTTAPAGYLVCDGSLVLRATYPELYAVVGDRYGVNDGSTNFALPDHRGRVTLGSGRAISGVIGANPGDSGGVDSIALSVQTLFDHAHSVPFVTRSDNFLPRKYLDPFAASGVYVAGVDPRYPTNTKTTTPAGAQGATSIVQAAIVELVCIKF